MLTLTRTPAAAPLIIGLKHAGLAHLSSILASQSHRNPNLTRFTASENPDLEKLFQAAEETFCAVLSAFRAYRASSIPSRSASAHGPELWASSFLRIAIAASA